MPDGQIPPALPYLTAAGTHPLHYGALVAQNMRLQSALERQQAKSANLRSILHSMDIASLCVSRDLKLRLYTQAAGQLLGLVPGQLALAMALSGKFDLHGKLMARIKAVLHSGTIQQQLLHMPSGRMMLCRLVPQRSFAGGKTTVDGVVITFVQPDAAPDTAAVTGATHLGGGLTPRQHQVLGHVLAGHPSKNIAADLGISRRTVENHRAAIMARTGATSLPALARLAVGADVGGDCKPALSRPVFGHQHMRHAAPVCAAPVCAAPAAGGALMKAGTVAPVVTAPVAGFKPRDKVCIAPAIVKHCCADAGLWPDRKA